MAQSRMSDIEEDEYSDEEQEQDPAEREREFTLRQFGIHAALPVADGEIDFNAGEQAAGTEGEKFLLGQGLRCLHATKPACAHLLAEQDRLRTPRITSSG